MWEVRNAEWHLKEEKDGTLTLVSARGLKVEKLSWSEVRALNAISAEADQELSLRSARKK